MSVSTPQALDTVLELPLGVAMFTVGLVFIWIAAEVYERLARSLRGKQRFNCCSEVSPAAFMCRLASGTRLLVVATVAAVCNIRRNPVAPHLC